MRQWLPHLDSFRDAIWRKIVSGGTIETSLGNNQAQEIYARIEIPKDSFRIFGFLDDTGFRTTAPGLEARRTMGFYDDV